MANIEIDQASYQLITDLFTWPEQRQDQTHVVEEFQEKLDKMYELWMNWFVQILLWIVVSIMSSLIYDHYTNPWEMKCYAYFKDKQVEAEMITIINALAVIACVMASYAFSCFCKHKRPNLLVSIFLGIVVAVFWLYYMLRVPMFRWDFIWLPMTPSCWYVDYLLDESQAAIDKLINSIQ